MILPYYLIKRQYVDPFTMTVQLREEAIKKLDEFPHSRNGSECMKTKLMQRVC